MEKKVKSENVIINMLRAILCVTIMWNHFYGAFVFNADIINYCAVDAFFIISGYFLSKSIRKYEKKEDISILTIIMKKLRSIYPVYLFGLVLMLLYMIFLRKNFEFTSYNISGLVGEVLVLHRSGFFPLTMINGTDWYVSAMLLSMIILLVIVKYMKGKYHYFGFAVVLGIYFAQPDFINHGQNYFTFLNGGIIRGTGGILVGIILFDLVNEKLSIRINRRGVELLWIVSFVAMLGNWMLIGYTECYRLTIVNLFLWSILIGVSEFIKSEKIVNVCSMPFIKALGHLSMYIFLIQWPLFYLWNYVMGCFTINTYIVKYGGLLFIVGIAYILYKIENMIYKKDKILFRKM